jgi:hypothetical protein
MIFYEKPSHKEFTDLCACATEPLTDKQADRLFYNSVHYMLVNVYGVPMAIAGYTHYKFEVFLILRKGFARNKFSIIKKLKKLVKKDIPFVAHVETDANQKFAEFFGFKDLDLVELIDGKPYRKLVREATK